VATVVSVSVDLVGTMRVPVSVDQLVATARDTLGQLLGLGAVPVIEVIAGRRYDQGRLVDPGRRLGADEMRSTVIGEDVLGPIVEFVTADGDGARLMVFDHCGLDDLDDSHDVPDVVDACFSPHRTCVGVVMATALALAAAGLGGGEFVDIEIMMLRPPVARPDRVIELTALHGGESGFGERCERYMRQFAHLGGWPRAVHLTG